MKGHFGAVALIAVGVFWLLNNLGLINVSLAELFRVWWPVILILLGVGMFFTPNKTQNDQKKE